MRLFKIAKGNYVRTEEVNKDSADGKLKLKQKDERFNRFIHEEECDKDLIFNVEDIIIDPIKSLENKNYRDIIEYNLKRIGIDKSKLDEYKDMIQNLIDCGYYGFVDKGKIILADFDIVEVL